MTKKFRMPTSFELGGQTITIHMKEGMSKTDAHGLSRYDDCEIWFDADLKPEDLKGITFYHEVMHFVFHTLGRDNLKDDEGLVDSVGNLLWQVHKTAKYE